MIDPGSLNNGMVEPLLTERQREVAALIDRYVQAAGEMPSAGWISRQLEISRQTALEHVQILRRKQWFGPYRR